MFFNSDNAYSSPSLHTEIHTHLSFDSPAHKINNVIPNYMSLGMMHSHMHICLKLITTKKRAYLCKENSSILCQTYRIMGAFRQQWIAAGRDPGYPAKTSTI